MILDIGMDYNPCYSNRTWYTHRNKKNIYIGHNMTIRKLNVRDKKDVNKWIEFPFELYKGNKQWVPPLIDGVKTQLNPEKHPFYAHSTADFFVSEKNGKTLGRIALLHNIRFNKYRGEKAGQFAFFEVVEDIQVARELFNLAFDWCVDKGFDIIYGPNGMIGADASGVLVEGFEHRPALNVPYNHSYYDTFIKDSGFVKERDALSGYIDAKKAELPERVAKIAERIMARRGFSIKTFKTKDEMRAMVPQVREVHHQAFGQGYGYYPHTDEEYEFVAKDLIAIADPGLIKLVMKGDQVIGFLFAYKDISAGIQRAKGKFLPFGWIPILWDKQFTKWVNVNGIGILPEYQGLGANAIMYYALAKTIKSYKFEHADTVIIGEENYKSFSDNVAVGVTWYKRHRLYKKEL